MLLMMSSLDNLAAAFLVCRKNRQNTLKEIKSYKLENE